MYPIILNQLKFTHKDHLVFPFEERGLQFGDGIYEVIRIYQGRYYLFEEHMDRLFESANSIKLSLPFSKQQLSEKLIELIQRNNMVKDGKLYLQITRGSAPRDHSFPNNVEPNMYAYIQDVPRLVEAFNNGVNVITTRDIRWENCYIKSLNLLPNVLAKQEAVEKGCFEAILHRNGIVTECSSANIYLVKDGKIFTHPATNNILRGCVRIAVERLAHSLNIPFIEKAFTIDDIQHADEMFLTSSISEILPVVQVDDSSIKNGKPGKITRLLQKAYEKDAQLTSILKN